MMGLELIVVPDEAPNFFPDSIVTEMTN